MARSRINSHKPLCKTEEGYEPSKHDGSCSSVGTKKGRPGKKRGPRSMGRHPFLAWMNKYLESSGLAPVTLKERERRLRRILTDLQSLSDKGIIKTTNPEKMDEKTVGAFVDLLLARKLKGKSLEHELTALNQMLRFAGNAAVDAFKLKHPSVVRKCSKTERHPHLTGMEFTKLVDRANSLDGSDWTALESYAIVILSVCSGARHKELIGGSVHDLILEPGCERYHIAHPKGEDTYGGIRDPPIRPEGIAFLKRYLKSRSEMLTRHPEDLFLFPAYRKKVAGRMSDNSLTKMVRWVGEDAQVIGLCTQKCRRTYGQFLVDEGLPIENVSVLLGHSSTKTTEKYYCRTKEKQACNAARQLWGQSQVVSQTATKPVTVNTPLIERSKWDAGYA